MFSKKTLLAMTAATIMVTSAPAMAEEQQQGWWGGMVESVQSWYSDDAQTADTSAEVDAYLDEITIAIPPMTGDEAAKIEPAAGGDVQNIIVEDNVDSAPVGMQSNDLIDLDEQSYNADFTNTEGSIAAFDNPDGYMNVDDMANIMPASGDAEAVNDAAVVVVSQDVEDVAKETAENAAEVTESTAEATVAETTKTMTEEVMDSTSDAASAVADDISDMADSVATGTTDALDAADKGIKSGLESMNNMISGDDDATDAK